MKRVYYTFLPWWRRKGKSQAYKYVPVDCGLGVESGLDTTMGDWYARREQYWAIREGLA